MTSAASPAPTTWSVSRVDAQREELGGAAAARADQQDGQARLRYLLVEAAWRVLRTKDPGAVALRAWAERIALRRGRRVASVALARRLAGILYAMWRDGQDYHVSLGAVAAVA